LIPEFTGISQVNTALALSKVLASRSWDTSDWMREVMPKVAPEARLGMFTNLIAKQRSKHNQLENEENEDLFTRRAVDAAIRCVLRVEEFERMCAAGEGAAPEGAAPEEPQGTAPEMQKNECIVISDDDEPMGPVPVPRAIPVPQANPVPQAIPVPQANPVPQAIPVPQAKPVQILDQKQTGLFFGHLKKLLLSAADQAGLLVDSLEVKLKELDDLLRAYLKDNNDQIQRGIIKCGEQETAFIKTLHAMIECNDNRLPALLGVEKYILFDHLMARHNKRTAIVKDAVMSRTMIRAFPCKVPDDDEKGKTATMMTMMAKAVYELRGWAEFTSSVEGGVLKLKPKWFESEWTMLELGKCQDCVGPMIRLIGRAPAGTFSAACVEAFRKSANVHVQSATAPNANYPMDLLTLLKYALSVNGPLTPGIERIELAMCVVRKMTTKTVDMGQLILQAVVHLVGYLSAANFVYNRIFTRSGATVASCKPWIELLATHSPTRDKTKETMTASTRVVCKELLASFNGHYNTSPQWT